MSEAGHAAHILIVDDEPNVRRVLGAMVEEAGWTATTAAGGDEALALVRSEDPDLVLTDLKMPGMDGMELLGRVRAEFPEIPVVLLTAHGTIASAVEAMRRGAHDFLSKPFERDRVIQTIEQALGQARGARSEFQGPLVEGARCGIIGDSPPMRDLMRLIERVAPSPSTVLIVGETGTGKELVAEAIHSLSARGSGPMVRINCGALPETLVEAELFGHERGAFTGADRARPGRFELADGGTLFLDEIGELPLAAQVKLLRVLQDGLIDRIGSASPRRVDVRLAAATHSDLSRCVAEGTFREDLYYRLKVVELRLPPLRERTGDVPALVGFFLDRSARRLGRPRPGITQEALALLASRPWPGNVRELQNVVERAVLLSDAKVLGCEDFVPVEPGPATAGGPVVGGVPPATRPAAAGGAGAEVSDIKAASRAAAVEAERRLILAALGSTEGNVTRAASKLGLSRRGLQMKMKELGLRDPALRTME